MWLLGLITRLTVQTTLDSPALPELLKGAQYQQNCLTRCGHHNIGANRVLLQLLLGSVAVGYGDGGITCGSGYTEL